MLGIRTSSVQLLTMTSLHVIDMSISDEYTPVDEN